MVKLESSGSDSTSPNSALARKLEEEDWQQYLKMKEEEEKKSLDLIWQL